MQRRDPHARSAAGRELQPDESTGLRARSVYAWFVVAALTGMWFALAAGRPLNDPDEGRYAEIAREMLVSGDWVTPRLNDLAYLEKPPLQYWTIALAYRLFGPSEWTARLWTVLCGWLDVVFVFLLARRLWNLRTAVIAAALLASTVMHFAMGQILTLDMAFTSLMTAMLCTFCMARLSRDSAPRQSKWWMLASWATLSFATLTKGIVALVIAGFVLSIYSLWQRDRAVWRTLRPGVGLIVLIVITLPWFILVAHANPDFLRFFFIHEHLQRYLTDSAHRVEPWWYFLAVFAAGALPWLPQMSSALFNGWRASVRTGQFDARRLLWVWCVFVLVFFSLSNSKLAPYVLPIFPPLALLTAARESSGRVRWMRVSVWTMPTCALALLVYTFVDPSEDAIVRQAILSARPAVLTLALVAALVALLGHRALLHERPLQTVVTLAIGWFLGLSLLFATIGHEETLRSGRALAAQIPADLAARTHIFSVQTYDQTLPFYLQRTMTLVDTRGELDYGLRHEPEKGIADMGVFEQTWQNISEAIAIMPPATYAKLSARELPMRVLGRDRRRVAVSRR